ncbi:MAG: InlB B-repeat-containing protein, partial [Johnsonella sp.]|nr:InlB B-repeat-containing protein [Johnsonella sp.]
MKAGIKTGIAALLFVVLLAAQIYAYPGGASFDAQNSTINQITVKEGIPVRFHFNGGFYDDRAGNIYTDYLEKKTDQSGKISDYCIPKREGYVFIGWSRVKDEINSETLCTFATVYEQKKPAHKYLGISPIDIYAYWAEDKSASGSYVIQFEMFNQGKVNPLFLYTNEKGKLPYFPLPEREGYIFLFWSGSAGTGGGGAEEEKYRVDENFVFQRNGPVFAHWVEEVANQTINREDYWEYKITGEYWRENWKEINGSWYYFDENEKMLTGWFNQEGNWYYLSEKADADHGKMMTGWQQIDGSWYYFYPNSSSGKPAGS